MSASNIERSVVLLTSSNADIREFGTGFIIGANAESTFLVTCAHVVQDLGFDDVMVSRQPAMVVVSGTEMGVDLAVLRVDSRLSVDPLSIDERSVYETDRIKVCGFEAFDKQYMLREIYGVLGSAVSLEERKTARRLAAWHIDLDDGTRLQRGHSGSPVLRASSDEVIGVVSHRLGLGDKGVAISVKELYEICPREILPVNSPASSNSRAKIRAHRRHLDWGGSSQIDKLHGRKEEIETLTRWLVKEECRLVTILGMGGQGKTQLVLALAHLLPHAFDYVIWRSLKNAPPLTDLLLDVSRTLPVATDLGEAPSEERQLSVVLEALANHRCLIILDNFESILSDKEAGGYLLDYDGYGKLLQRVSGENHCSCVLLTTDVVY